MNVLQAARDLLREAPHVALVHEAPGREPLEARAERAADAELRLTEEVLILLPRAEVFDDVFVRGEKRNRLRVEGPSLKATSGWS